MFLHGLFKNHQRFRAHIRLVNCVGCRRQTTLIWLFGVLLADTWKPIILYDHMSQLAQDLTPGNPISVAEWK